MRKRTIRKYGNTFIIPLSTVDMKDFELEVGDEVDIEDLLVLNNKKKVKKK